MAGIDVVAVHCRRNGNAAGQHAFCPKIGSWIYESPTVQQLNHLNLLLRKLAHVFLYAILGGMMALLWQLLLELHRIGWRILGAAACSTTIAFWTNCKIPIAGRHFDFSESLLNAGSARGHSAVFRNCRTAFPKEVNFISETKSLELQK
ncbi:MAG: hypothetical protein ACLT3Y_08120 [Ruminococcus callidus]